MAKTRRPIRARLAAHLRHLREQIREKQAELNYLRRQFDTISNARSLLKR